ncbi:MAG: hypothetical protein GC129_02995 [Proteobacteria bacterium]|nr:hypothetical protein [Pseudomonadota bacterium]
MRTSSESLFKSLPWYMFWSFCALLAQNLLIHLGGNAEWLGLALMAALIIYNIKRCVEITNEASTPPPLSSDEGLGGAQMLREMSYSIANAGWFVYRGMAVILSLLSGLMVYFYATPWAG